MTTARDIRTAAENLARCHAEYLAHKHNLYNPDATEEERRTAEHCQAASINAGAAWMQTWKESGYTNDLRNGEYRARRIHDLAAKRYAQITGKAAQ